MWLGVNLNLVSASGARVLPVYSKFLDSKVKGRSRIRVLASENGNLSSTVLSSDSVGSAAVSIGKEILNGTDSVNGKLGSGIGKKKVGNEEELEVLWEDGFGTNTVTDYFELAKDFTKPDGGPPRWFSPVECGCPVKNSPLLLFLPGMDGLGLGLVLHQKSLGRVFEVRCLHIPVYDRTPFQGLVKFVENTVRTEYALFPNRPIYLVGDSFGGCLALAVSARNPAIDLVLILANPATSFSKSPLQPLIPILEGLPEELHITVPYLLSCVMGEPVKLASVNVENRLPPAKRLEQISKNLTGLLPLLSGFNDIIPKETLLWKLKLLKSADSYTNSRLHAVKSEVLVLASGKDNMLPSKDEAQRLWNTLEKCKVRFFKENGHTLLLEDAPSLVSILKGTTMYRRSTKRDFISDYIPPSDTEYEEVLNQGNGYRVATSPVMLSTLENGKIVKGLAGVPDEGPVLFVGYHMLMGLELAPLIEEFLNVKRIMLRGMAHPTLFTENVESSLQENSYLDQVRQFGAVPVTPSNLYRLLSSKSFVLLYPGGAREALHRKGEEYKLFWPDQPEFVRMAARFEATIVPFGVVGEDDIAEMVLDYNDQMKIPILKDWIRQQNDSGVRLRTDVEGEVGEQDLFLPGVLPKIPGRFYYMFGKPIELKGKKEVMKDRENANALYLQVKSDIENIISYLKTKREQDPYRSIVDRTIYRAISMPADDVPSFDP